jgi:hypothetical protein
LLVFEECIASSRLVLAGRIVYSGALDGLGDCEPAPVTR